MPKKRIIVFSDGDGFEKATTIRKNLKRIGILNIMMIDLNYVFKQLTRSCKIGEDIITEGFNAMENNPSTRPVIFYGGSGGKADRLVKLCNFDNLTDIGWVLNPLDAKRLLKGVKHFAHLKK